MKSHPASLFGALAALQAVQDTVPPGAALAGPAFPAPSSLSGSQTLASAIDRFDQDIFRSPIVQANETAWAVAVFSTADEEPLYERYFTPDYDVGVEEVNRESIFRIASVSKVFSVWSFLMEVGDEHFNDPITRYVPELGVAGGPSDGVLYDDIDHVRWGEVTLGQLASHLAGIPRDPFQTDMSAQMGPQQAMAFGLPSLPDHDIPQCGVAGLMRECTRNETMAQLLKQHPIFPTGYSPAYSNIAYSLLGFAQEAITGQPVSSAISANILSTLNMTASSFTTPPSCGGVIPGNASAVGWDWEMGPIDPAGSIYSSAGDMLKAGRSILKSTTLSAAQTRRWLKPMSQTGVLGSAVGAPWEIRHLLLDNKRLTQLYTKQGDMGGYRAALVLSPEHGLGAVVFSAGPIESNSAAVRETLMNTVGTVFLPAAELQAREEVRSKFAGTYTDAVTNSSVTINVDTSNPGLIVTHLSARGVEVIGPSSPFIPLYSAGQSARLFPSGLRTERTKGNGTASYVSRLGFRASFFNATAAGGAVQDPGLIQWTSLGAPAYGGVTLDEWVFGMGEDGVVQEVDVRMLRVKMGKK